MKTPEENKDCVASQMAEEYARCEGNSNETHEEGLREGFLAGYQAAKPQWISVKERLPEMKEVALVFSKSTYLNVAHRVVDDKGWCWSTPSMSIAPHEITHWMPLPEPPKEEK